MRPEHVALCFLGLAGLPLRAPAQVAFDVANPTLPGLTVTANAAWSPGGYYEYGYVLTNGTASTGALLMFQVDVTQLPNFATGGALPMSGPGRILEPSTTGVPVVPIGLGVPQNWYGVVSSEGFASWGIDSRPNRHLNIGQMAPGTTAPTLVLRSYDPPGAREFRAVPVWHASDPGVLAVGEDDVVLRGQTFGPVPATYQETQGLFRGGSNNPAVVDHFLTYRVPTQKVTTLSAGQKAIVIVHFGDTTIPASFKATWNKTDITSRLVASPGRFAALALDPQPGRNVLELSISGAKPDGAVATDQDRLIWEAP